MTELQCPVSICIDYFQRNIHQISLVLVSNYRLMILSSYFLPEMMTLLPRLSPCDIQKVINEYQIIRTTSESQARMSGVAHILKWYVYLGS